MTELTVLVGLSLLVFVSAAVQHAGTVLARGVGFAMTDRSQPLPETGFSGRSRRALQNTLESSAMMAPLLVVVLLSQSASPVSATAGTVYLIARTAFILFYWAGLNRLRSLSWAVGMASILVMLGIAIGSLAGSL